MTDLSRPATGERTSTVAGRPPSRGLVLVAVLGFVAFLLLTTEVVTTGGVDAFDLRVQHVAVGLRSPAVTAVAQAVTRLGSPPVVVGFALVAAALLRWRTHRWTSSLLLLVSVVVTAGVVYLVKIAVGRPRPGADHLLGIPSMDYAYPSGHTTDGGMVLALTVVLLAPVVRSVLARRTVVLVGLLLAILIGPTRVYLGYHWATDVLGGWFLATTVVAVATYAAGALGAPNPGSAGPAGALVTGSPAGQPGDHPVTARSRPVR